MRKTIGFVAHENADMSAPFFRTLREGFEEGSIRLSLCFGGNENEDADGYLFVAPEGDDPRLQRLRRRGTPVLVVAGRSKEFLWVDIDNVDLARQATAHLLSLGRRRVAVINGKMDTSNGQDREKGFRLAMDEARGSVCEDLRVEGAFSRAGGRAAMLKLIGTSPQPDAVFAANDHMALGAWDVLRERGIQVPEDIALIGIDNVPESAFRGLSSIQQPLRALGRFAAVRMDIWLATGCPPTPGVIMDHGVLVPRRSTVGPTTGP